MDNNINLVQLASDTLDDCAGWRIYQLGHGLVEPVDLSAYPEDLQTMGEEFYNEIVKQALERMPQADFNWIQLGTRFPRLVKEYMIFGPLNDDVSFWDVMDAYDLISVWTRVRKTVYECDDIKDWGWFFLKMPGWFDVATIEAALNNYYKKICWKYSEGAEYCRQEMERVMKQDEE